MPGKRARGSPPATHRVPSVEHDYRADPAPYPALKTEQGVFTTPPYSAEIKPLWRFKDEDAAKHSAEEIWRLWEGYKRDVDFIGWIRFRLMAVRARLTLSRMDTARKFIQMGRTRSLRYALRPGGRKYAYVSDGNDGDKGESSSKAASSSKPSSLKATKHSPACDDAADDVDDDHPGGRRKVAMKRTGEVYDEEKLKGAQVFEGYLDRCWADEVYSRAWEAWKRGDRDVFTKSPLAKKTEGGVDESAEDSAPSAQEDSKPGPKKRPRTTARRKKA